MVALHQGWITEQQSMPFVITFYLIGTLLLGSILIRNARTEIQDSVKRSQSEESRAMWTAANQLPSFQDPDAEFA